MPRTDPPANGSHGPPAPIEDAFYDTASPAEDAKALEHPLRKTGRKLRRLAPWMLGAFVLLLVTGWAVLGPFPVTRADTPDLIAQARLNGAQLARELATGEPGPVRAAVGGHSLTPDPPNHVRMGGYPGAIRKSVGIDGTLKSFSWVMRAGVGPACALMGGDLLMVTPELASEVSAEVLALGGIPRDRTIFTASHTHSSIGNYGRTLAESFALGASETGIYFVSWRWAPTAWTPTRNMRPAVVRAGQPTAPLLIDNRTDRTGLVDPTVDVLQLDVDGEEPSLLVLFGAHPTTEARRDWMTPDYPGPMRDEVSRHIGAFVNFAGGALGSMEAQVPFGGRHPDHVGKLLATQVMSAVRPRASTESVSAMNARVSCGRAPLPLPSLRIPVSSTLALSTWASTNILEPPATFNVSALLVGSTLLLSFPGEISGEVTLPLRKRARERGYVLSIASFSGEYAGYLLPANRFGKGVEAPLQLAGVGAAAPAVAFAEGLIEALPQGPLPADARADRVWPGQ